MTEANVKLIMLYLQDRSPLTVIDRMHLEETEANETILAQIQKKYFDDLWDYSSYDDAKKQEVLAHIKQEADKLTPLDTPSDSSTA